MDKHSQLAAWMAGGMRDYNKGVSILIELDIDRDSHVFFQTKVPQKLHYNMLRKKLINYARVHKVKPAFSPQKQIVKAIHSTEKVIHNQNKKFSDLVLIDSNPVVRFEDLPEEYQQKFRLAGELKTQEKTLHAELKLLAPKETKEAKERRAYLSRELVNIKKQTKTIWSEIDSWWKANKSKTKEQRIADQAAQETLVKQKNIKAYKMYIERNYGVVSKQEVVKDRMKKLDKWGVKYDKEIEKAKTRNHTN